MPPISDKLLRERILRAAHQLWSTKGEAGLTLRAVAIKAKTTTPTVYSRFRNKADLRVALARKVKEELLAYVIDEGSTIESIAPKYLDFAEEHPRDYDLLRSSWSDIFGLDNPRPGREWMMKVLAENHGGIPGDYSSATYGILLLCHGAACMLAETSKPEARAEVKKNCLRNVDRMLNNIHLFRDKRP